MLFDTHIHLDQFSDQEIADILQQPNLQSVLAVATDLASCERLLALKEQYSKLYIAAGFHPEQALLSENEIEKLFDFIAKNHQKLTACGEVGLPHYRKRENPILDYQPYIDLLERFIVASKRYNLPLNLHIVYEDTEIALELLAKHQIQQAHFHWFKASDETLEKLLLTPYFVSLTPDILTNPKTQNVAQIFPLARILIETDAPWQHEGFEPVEITQQLSAVIKKLAEIKQLPEISVTVQIKQNTRSFYLI
ncbi:TatD family hydrolase [Mannheimia pernigra]|uniref:TatD family hydrolase n=1 Tax=Mannheimia pernigra TaxID=111844 RepID=UPI0013199A0A|nr:TatD family hydrolase [Mannheimia pernigra]QHB17787.1 TatD family deoxyribonuclease [Mannheimia pernigra]